MTSKFVERLKMLLTIHLYTQFTLYKNKLFIIMQQRIYTFTNKYISSSDTCCESQFTNAYY